MRIFQKEIQRIANICGLSFSREELASIKDSLMLPCEPQLIYSSDEEDPDNQAIEPFPNNIPIS